MSVIVNKIKSDYDVQQLQREINANANIVPSCLSITGVGSDLAIEFVAAISGPEDGELDAVVLAHVKPEEYIAASALPYSELDDTNNRKLAVHPSYKPAIDGTTYAVWTGCGDYIDPLGVDPSILGGGELLHFDMVPETPVNTIDIKFDHAAFGRIWIHEAYLKFSGGGNGDYVSSDIMASGANVIDHTVSLDLILVGDLVKYAPGGPGTGTHGFASTPTLLPRTFSHDGSWNYDGVSLTPNMDDTGDYHISTVEQSVHRYVNKIPTYGECPYFSMSSDETAEINNGYFIRADVHNVSNTAWHLSVIMEIYRERTIDP